MEKETKTLLAIGAVGVVGYLLLNKKKKKTDQIATDTQTVDNPAPNNGYPLNLLGAFESADPFAGLFVTNSNDLPSREDVETLSSVVEEMPTDLALRVQQWVNAFNRIADPTLPLLDEDGVAGPATDKALVRAIDTRRAAQSKYEAAGYDCNNASVLKSSNRNNYTFYRIHLPTRYNFKLIAFPRQFNIDLVVRPLIVTEAEAQAIRAAGSDINYYCTLYQNTTKCVDGVFTLTDNWKNGVEDSWNYLVPTNIGS